jgi:hypothetical protein
MNDILNQSENGYRERKQWSLKRQPKRIMYWHAEFVNLVNLLST